jgi:hypothetical protein
VGGKFFRLRRVYHKVSFSIYSAAIFEDFVARSKSHEDIEDVEPDTLATNHLFFT